MTDGIRTSVVKRCVLLAEGVIANTIGSGCVLLKVLVVMVYILHGGRVRVLSAA
jgi:hypothetical protein